MHVGTRGVSTPTPTVRGRSPCRQLVVLPPTRCSTTRTRSNNLSLIFRTTGQDSLLVSQAATSRKGTTQWRKAKSSLTLSLLEIQPPVLVALTTSAWLTLLWSFSRGKDLSQLDCMDLLAVR